MSVDKDTWKRRHGSGGLSASQFGSALGLRGCVSDFIHYERNIRGKVLELEFTGNQATMHGVKVEPISRAIYELWTGLDVEDGGFHTHPRHPFLACSPDGRTVDTGIPVLLELKSPVYQLFHPGRKDNMNCGIPKSYMCQMQGQMHVSGVEYCDFFVYVKCTGVFAGYRVRRNREWWEWALPKLELVAKALSSPEVPCELTSRSFGFSEFNYDGKIEVYPLIPSGESLQPYYSFQNALYPTPRAPRFKVGDIVRIRPTTLYPHRQRCFTVLREASLEFPHYIIEDNNYLQPGEDEYGSSNIPLRYYVSARHLEMANVNAISNNTNTNVLKRLRVPDVDNDDDDDNTPVLTPTHIPRSFAMKSLLTAPPHPPVGIHVGIPPPLILSHSDFNQYFVTVDPQAYGLVLYGSNIGNHEYPAVIDFYSKLAVSYPKVNILDLCGVEGNEITAAISPRCAFIIVLGDVPSCTRNPMLEKRAGKSPGSYQSFFTPAVFPRWVPILYVPSTRQGEEWGNNNTSSQVTSSSTPAMRHDKLNAVEWREGHFLSRCRFMTNYWL
eukprot:PhF_6_TR3724/c1_g4_i1/m.5334